MNDDGSNPSASAVATGSLRSSANPAALELSSIPDANSLHFATTLGRVARMLLMMLALVLLLPAMLILTAIAIMVTRALGVPLYAPYSPPAVRNPKRSSRRT